MLTPTDRLIVALDVSNAEDARRLVQSIGESATIYKVGKQLFTAEGPSVVRDLIASGKKVFLDLKFHDIPNTVAGAVSEAAKLGVTMLTVHASGGRKMLEAAAQTARQSQTNPLILAVTVLTSMSAEDAVEIGWSDSVEKQVERLAGLAIEAGCKGIVASPLETKTLRARFGNEFAIVTPGIRPEGAERGDQSRTMTPSQAIEAGATYIVVGRPITSVPNPADAARQICSTLQ